MNPQQSKSMILKADLGEYQMAPEVLENTEIGQEDHQDTVQKLKGYLSRAICSTEKLRDITVPDKPKVIHDWQREGDIGFVFASRGVGKTWFSFDMARAIAIGAPFGPWQTNGARTVLYIDGEVSASDMQSRAAALEAHHPNLHYLNHELLFEDSQSTIDISELAWQESILGICGTLKVKVIFLDNLSCLAPFVDENEGVAWSSQLLNWVLGFRRRGVSVIFIQHAGRNGQMRGHSRREDPANWIIRLTKNHDNDKEEGAKFISHFAKNRNASKLPTDTDWWYKQEGSRTLLTTKPATRLDRFKALVKAGVESNKEIAEKLEIQAADVSRLAKIAADEGDIKINKGKYEWIEDGNG